MTETTSEYTISSSTGSGFTAMKTEDILEEQEFALSYAVERCLDTKFDSSELRGVRQVCRKALEEILQLAAQAAGREYTTFEYFKDRLNLSTKEGYKDGMGGFNILEIGASQRAMHRVEALWKKQ